MEDQPPKFTLDNMLYQMCVSSTWREEFDMKSAYYTEYWPNQEIHTRYFETVDIPMDTELTLMEKFAALELIQKYFDEDEVVISAMNNHNMFATRKDNDGNIIVIGWNDRSR
jgi:hypothetical protein